MSRILRAFPTFHVPESQDQPSLQAHLTTECPNANQVPRPLGSPDPHPRPILQNLKGMRPLGPLMRTDTEPRDLDSDQNLRGPRDRITDMKGPFSTVVVVGMGPGSVMCGAALKSAIASLCGKDSMTPNGVEIAYGHV